MKENLDFQVKLTAKDLWQFSMYHAYAGASGVFCLIFTLASLFLLVTRWGFLNIFQRVMLVVCALIFTVWQPVLLYLKAGRQAKKTSVSMPMSLCFGKEGLTVRQDGQTAEFAWEQIGRVDRMKTMAILYMDRVHAYLIPQSVMGQNEEAFYELMKEHLPQGRSRWF